jgi:hypothetical protein
LTSKARDRFGPVEAAQERSRGLAVEKLATISSRVSASAVAVKAASGTPSAAQRADAQVIGPEIMAPLADAMRLVHGDQR